VAVVLGLSAPARVAADPDDREAWVVEVVRLGVDPEQVVYPFNPSPAMEDWAAQVLRRHRSGDPTERLAVLQRALFDADFGFTYDQDLTLTAREAFEARRGNCMSFTSLFVTLARLSGVDAFLMSVQRPPEVDRVGDLVVVNRHVVAAFRSDPGTYRIFDFYIQSESGYMGRRALDDVEVTAMFHTNLGGEAIRAGDMDLAVRHLRIATTLAPEWSPGWINLGVANSRLGDSEAAFEAYRRALEADPHCSSALTNMAAIYQEQGLEAEADNALRAAAHQTTNPFTLISMADAEMLAGRAVSARKYLRRARRWYPEEPEVQFALARLAAHLGDADRAARHQQKGEALAASAE
jgi:Flp pilus assembly protein TadD